MRRRIDPRREDGVAMAEFAIVAPVFLLIVVGLLVFGRLFFYWIQTNHLANETARWAAVDRNPYGPGQTLQEAARATATKEFSDSARVCIDYPNNTGPSAPPVGEGDPVRVRVVVPVTFAKFFGFGVDIRGTATMRIERLENTTSAANYTPTAPFGACS